MDQPYGDLHARIGIARADITPSTPIRSRLWGAATHEFADGVHRPLTATALAVLGPTSFLLISLDLCEWVDADAESGLRRRIAETTGVALDQIALHSTHTHSAAAPRPVAPERPEPDPALAAHLAQLEQAVLAACTAAIADAEPAVLSWGRGHCALAGHRDAVASGIDVVGYDPTVAVDDTVLVGRATAEADGRMLAVLVSYACHPTVLGWANRLLSPDYVGALRELVEDHYPQARCLFVQGASGELAPARQYVDDPAVADSAGRALGYAVLSALELMPPPDQRLQPSGIVESGARLGVWSPVSVAPSERLTAARLMVELERSSAAKESLDGLPAHVRAEREARAVEVAKVAGDEASIRYPLWLWQWGELVVLAHPGEAYSWLAGTLREALAPRPVLIANLTNGAGAFYLPPADAYERPGYTVNQTPAAAGSLERIASAVLNHLTTTNPGEAL